MQCRIVGCGWDISGEQWSKAVQQCDFTARFRPVAGEQWTKGAPRCRVVVLRWVTVYNIGASRSNNEALLYNIGVLLFNNAAFLRSFSSLLNKNAALWSADEALDTGSATSRGGEDGGDQNGLL